MSFFLNDLSSMERLIWTVEKDELVDTFMGQMGYGRKMDGSDLGAEAMRDWTPEDRFRGLRRKPKHELVLKVKAATVQNTGGPLRLLETIWKLNGSPSNVVPSGYLNTQDFGGAGYTFNADGKEYQNRVSRFVYLFYASDDKKALNRFKKFGHEYEYEKGSQKTKWSFARRGGRGTVIEKYLGMFRKAKPKSKSKSITGGRMSKKTKKSRPTKKMRKDDFDQAVSYYSRDRARDGRKAWSALVKEYGMFQARKIAADATKLDAENDAPLAFFPPAKNGKKKVPEHMTSTPRKGKASKVYVFPSRKSYPIGDLYHARKAVLQSMWPNNLKKAGKVLRSVVRKYPKYDWASYWNKERKEAKNKRNIKTYGQTIKQK